jgi:hypothetical protein
MATWKKLIVSGSNVSQLTNDAGYLTSVTAQTAYVTASIGTTHLIANNSNGQLKFNTGSNPGLDIVGNAGTDTLTFSITDGIISGSGQVDINSTTGTLTTLGTVTSGNVTAILPSGVVSGSSQIQDASVTQKGIVELATTAETTTGTDTARAVTPDGLKDGYQGSTNVTTLGTVTTGDIDAILPTGTVSGSISSGAQGTITINGNDIDLGVQTGDSPRFTNLTVTGDLNIQGTTTQVQTTNLNVEDRFILLNSGSSTATDESGIIFGGSTGVANSGSALIWNGDYNGNDGRLAISNGIGHDATSAAVSYYVAGVFDGTVAAAATAQADHRGNIRVDSSDDIFIYV